MRQWRRNGFQRLCLLLLAILLAGCTPTVDNSLSPPVVGKPIYDCAQIIAFSGADRDSKVRVYVNGSKVTELGVWMGWGAIKLPSALHTGDVVSAEQVVGNRLSAKTRDPVTAVSIPASVLVHEKLPTPVVVPPLYECQQVVRVASVVEGATVILQDSDGNHYEDMTPYQVIRLGTPLLKVGQSFNAMQRMCEDKYSSDWSPKEPVQAKPSSLPEAKIREPLVAGSDACQVDNLIPGAEVEIYAGMTKVGGGVAPEASTIFHVSPAIDINQGYYATQGLCELKSKPPDDVTPVKESPAPALQPVCVGDKYVTVCGTVALSTVKVFVKGTQVAEVAGNGGCVTLALGDATTFGAGNQVTVTQAVAGQTSAASAATTPQASGAPAYDPAYWNSPQHVECNNCYNYACNIRNDEYAQPGYAHGIVHPALTCVDVGSAAQADGLQHQPEIKCAGCAHLVALVIAPGGHQDEMSDYHWYRLDDNGRWSNKPGPDPASDLDAAGNPITSPETANRRYVGPDYTIDYTIFCTYYCVDNSVVAIDGSYQCPY